MLLSLVSLYKYGEKRAQIAYDFSPGNMKAGYCKLCLENAYTVYE
jgi:hypothetical protein